ncbi:MAG: Flp pilus assembly complex ATPase component TadA [Candidatus Marinimicrobia bacterium]|nr:Flp pilus assembly complex ATPase component TadA [Candidatus Neomarinimicrobiota bacterium]
MDETLQPLLDELCAAGFLPAETAATRLQSVGNDPLHLLQELARERPRDKNQLGKLWGNRLGVAYVDLDTVAVDEEAAQRISADFAREFQVLPLRQLGEVLTVATCHPDDLRIENELVQRFSCFAQFVFAFPDDLLDAIDIAYQGANSIEAIAGDIQRLWGSAGDQIMTVEQLDARDGGQRITKLVDGLILLALHERASDIHIEPDEDFVRIRFRIDGALQTRLTLDRVLLPPLVSRLKIMFGGDIAERRLPQDGRLRFALRDRKIDVRCSSVPTVLGERIVLRLLGQLRGRGIPHLSELHFSQTIRAGIDEISRAPNGVFFVTGPTGSGKTTTLYAVLKNLNRPDINIMTIEDPVEYRLPGANQIQVQPDVGLSFARALRAFLRQDPDVILIGEIRDAETARIAAQAALTGHLVFATMHTNNALQAVTRMIEIGVEPFLVAPSIIAVMAQRLVRRLCPHCREAYPAPPELADEWFEREPDEPVTLYRSAGCRRCRNQGFIGRLAIHELFVLNQQIRAAVAANVSVLEIERQARAAGYKSMRWDGAKKALRGLTTLAEVDRVCYAEHEQEPAP